jgi:DNA-binding transcriptional LysR family regulator
MIETYLLEALVAYDQYGTLIQTSENLHISQPALSRAMQKLELEMGVPLFNRQRNKLSLNENGKLAVEYARKILNLQQEMMESVKNLDAGTRTLSVGSIAPGPIYELEYRLGKAGVKSSFDLITKEEELISAYKKNKYQLIVLTHPLEGFPSKKLISEQLYALVMPAHPASEYDEISFKDMNGQSFLMLSDVGYWAEVVKQNMPDSRFIVQNTLQDLHELITSSALPAFASNITIERGIRDADGRVAVPFCDDAAKLDFYVIGAKKVLNDYF